MATLELSFISKVIQTGDIVPAIEARISPEHFTSERLRGVWEWLVEYWHEYGTSPVLSAFKRQYPEISLVDQTKVPYARLLAELREERRQVRLQEHLLDVVTQADKGDTKKAIAQMAAAVNELSFEASALKDIDVWETWEKRLAEYEERRKRPGVLRPGALPTGFGRLDMLTGGFSAQQLITLVGEAKVGKSTVTMLMAMACHAFGITPMFVSFEMSAQEQTDRHDAFIAHVNYTELMNGSLSHPDMERVRKELRKRKSMHPFIISEDRTAVTTLSGLRAKVQQHQPRILFVDGVYLMDDESGAEHGSPRALTNITRGMKRMAQQLEIPIVQTTQVLEWKLKDKKTKEVTGGAIGYSSSFVQDSDLVLAVERDPEQPNVSIIRVVLGRNVPMNKTVSIQWDWVHSNFEEIDGEEEASHGDSDD